MPRLRQGKETADVLVRRARAKTEARQRSRETWVSSTNNVGCQVQEGEQENDPLTTKNLGFQLLGHQEPLAVTGQFLCWDTCGF